MKYTLTLLAFVTMQSAMATTLKHLSHAHHQGQQGQQDQAEYAQVCVRNHEIVDPVIIAHSRWHAGDEFAATAFPYGTDMIFFLDTADDACSAQFEMAYELEGGVSSVPQSLDYAWAPETATCDDLPKYDFKLVTDETGVSSVGLVKVSDRK